MDQIEIEWKEFNQLFPKNDVQRYAKLPYSKLTKLLESKCLKTEFLSLKKIGRRVTVRLRNNKLSRFLHKICKNLHRLYAIKHSRLHSLDGFHRDDLNLRNGKVMLPGPKQLQDYVQSLKVFCSLVEGIVTSSVKAFGSCMPWVRLGHLVNHVLAISATVSRLFVIAKSILVYATDLLDGVTKFSKRLNFIGDKEATDIHTFVKSVAINSSINLQSKEKATTSQGPEWMSQTDIGAVVTRTDPSTLIQTVNKIKCNKRKNKKGSKS